MEIIKSIIQKTMVIVGARKYNLDNVNKNSKLQEENIPLFLINFKKSVTFSMILSIYKCKIS